MQFIGIDLGCKSIHPGSHQDETQQQGNFKAVYHTVLVAGYSVIVFISVFESFAQAQGVNIWRLFYSICKVNALNLDDYTPLYTGR